MKDPKNIAEDYANAVENFSEENRRDAIHNLTWALVSTALTGEPEACIKSIIVQLEYEDSPDTGWFIWPSKEACKEFHDEMKSEIGFFSKLIKLCRKKEGKR